MNREIWKVGGTCSISQSCSAICGRRQKPTLDLTLRPSGPHSLPLSEAARMQLATHSRMQTCGVTGRAWMMASRRKECKVSPRSDSHKRNWR
eukprot:720379-Rhodomonas_salina.6